jgi:hypothetical protein
LKSHVFLGPLVGLGVPVRPGTPKRYNWIACSNLGQHNT